MESWIEQTLHSGHAGLTVIFAVFLMGLVSVVSCGCNFATLGIIAGYSGTLETKGKTKQVVWSGIFLLSGTMVSLILIGVIIGYAGEIISNSFGNYWKIIAGLVSVFFGLYALNLIPFTIKIPGFSFKPENYKGNIYSSILFGFVVGGLSSACNLCCNPLFQIVLAATFIKGSMMWGLVMLLFFSLGYGLPLAAMMIGMGLGIGGISKVVSKIGVFFKYAGGIAMIAIGFYFLITI